MNDQVDVRGEVIEAEGSRVTGPRRLVLGVIALSVVAVLFGCQHRRAKELQVGDTVAVVVEVLGDGSVEYRSVADIEASNFAYYNFRNLIDELDPIEKSADLPEVVGRALWFRNFGTSGILVYLDESDRVTAVFRAAT